MFTIREMLAGEARAFLEVQRAAVRAIAAKDYSPAEIEAWAPLPVTEDDIELVHKNGLNSHRLVAEAEGRIVGAGALVTQNAELSACYVVPEAARKGVGSALVREIERTARQQGLTFLQLDSSVTAEPFYASLGYRVIERGEHILSSGKSMACVKMRKEIACFG